MFFIISKVLLCLLSPTLWILIFLVLALATKKQKLKKYSFRISLAILVLFSNTFLLNQFAKGWDIKQTTLPANTTYSCAIVLGGYVSEDANRIGYFNAASDRFIQAIKLKDAKKVSHLLLSGGNGMIQPTDFRESDWISSQLSDLKIEDTSVLVENQSRNSLENATFSKKVLDSNHLKPPYLLVTSGYHMRRAMYIFKKKDLMLYLFHVIILKEKEVQFCPILFLPVQHYPIGNFTLKKL